MRKSSFLLLSIFLLTACASGSFYNYSNKLKKDLVTPSKTSAEKPLKKNVEDIEKNKLNSLLYYQESGLYSFLKQDYNSALSYFNKAEQNYAYIDRQSELELKKLTNNTLAYTVLDDNSIPYNGSDYERALVHYYKALSYLANGNLSSSLIEFRASSQVQKFASHVREKKIDKAQRDIKKYGFKNDIKSQTGQKSLENELKIADLKSKFLNANSYYISGHIREAQGDANGALVDYKKALEIEPKNSYYIKDTYRLAVRFDRDFANLIEKNYKVSVADLKKYAQGYKNSNTVLVIQEQGFIPVKRQKNISFWIYTSAINIPLPYYNKNFPTYPALLFSLKDGKKNNFNDFEVASDVFRLEYSNLSEEYPLILARAAARQAVSTASTEAMRRTQRNNNGSIDAIALITSTAIESLENADLRSWRNLPARILVAKTNIEKDEDLYIKTNSEKAVTLSYGDVVGANNAPSLTIVYVYSVYGDGLKVQKHQKDIYNIIYKGLKNN